MPLPPANMTPWYGLIMLVGILITAMVWSRMFRGRPELAAVYIIGLLGALVGAKVGFLLAEWSTISSSDNFLLQAIVGKTIVGALLGGYIGVEAGKRLLNIREATGDRFALVVPAGLIMGRVGCLLHGCCLGIECPDGWWALHDASGSAHLPAPVFEMLFNVAALGVIGYLYRTRQFRGQLFHGYLIAYGLFRIGHEIFRATPRIALAEDVHITPYQLLAAALVAFAFWRMVVRHRQNASSPGAEQPAALPD